ncbi:DUF4279 domain-containing protein [Deinococcus marmoris]|uniref:DUF4279 domain-containing protein n=1 Tax=Deinococcus marmoris TaxID=249408 RepID=A0A1U7NXJ7_9DEIO|nr:DUF4279 domain-containing protein [Deinococcus marmoris]OLV17642.1 hypothetical protein BOO71_0008446 [Deinococcus marmoris]
MKDAAQQPYLYVYLDISGTFDPVVFSQTVGLVADEMRRRGEPLFAHLCRPAQVARTRKIDDWKLKVPTRHTFFISDMLDELLERVAGHEEKIRSTAQVLGLDVVLQVVAEWDAHTTSIPDLGLTGLQIERLAMLGASYGVDFYPLVTHQAGSYTAP